MSLNRAIFCWIGILFCSQGFSDPPSFPNREPRALPSNPSRVFQRKESPKPVVEDQKGYRTEVDAKGNTVQKDSQGLVRDARFQNDNFSFSSEYRSPGRWGVNAFTREGSIKGEIIRNRNILVFAGLVGGSRMDLELSYVGENLKVRDINQDQVFVFTPDQMDALADGQISEVFGSSTENIKESSGAFAAKPFTAIAVIAVAAVASDAVPKSQASS